MLYLDPANETSYNGSGLWKDLSGLGQDFTGTNMTQADQQESGYYNAMSIATNEYFSRTNDIYINGSSGEHTIQMWVKRVNSEREEIFFGKGAVNRDVCTWSLGTTDGQSTPGQTGKYLVCTVDYTGSVRRSEYTTTALTGGVWWNVAWAYHRVYNKLYINGEVAATDWGSGDEDDWNNSTSLENNWDPTIGVVETPYGQYYRAESGFGPAFFYNRQLSAQEIKHNYQLHANRFGLI
jgi:hypothetical protein